MPGILSSRDGGSHWCDNGTPDVVAPPLIRHGAAGSGYPNRVGDGPATPRNLGCRVRENYSKIGLIGTAYTNRPGAASRRADVSPDWRTRTEAKDFTKHRAGRMALMHHRQI
jgi:hypothetical protein